MMPVTAALRLGSRGMTPTQLSLPSCTGTGQRAASATTYLRPPGRPCRPLLRSRRRPSRLLAAFGRVRGVVQAGDYVFAAWHRSEWLCDSATAMAAAVPALEAAPLALLASSAWAQGPEADAPRVQSGEAGVAPAAEHAAQRLPCLDASHPRNCSTCDPTTRYRGRSGVDAARRRARHSRLWAGRLSHASRGCRFAGAARPLPPARRVCTSWWVTWAARTVRRPRLSDESSPYTTLRQSESHATPR